MKVKSLLIAAFAAISMTAIAGGTAERDNVYIKDCDAKVGDVIDLQIYLDNQTEYAAGQADLTLPDGLTAMMDEDDNWFTQAANSRWKGHMLVSSNPGDHLYRYVFAQLQNKRIKVGNDVMMSIKVKVEKEGQLKGKITKVHWSTGIPSENFVNDGDGPDTEFTVTATSTGINDVTAADAVKAYKVIENGQIYIVNGDKKYNVMGAEVK